MKTVWNILAHLSKNVASSLLSSTLCLTPAHRWQFISWPRVMNTPEPEHTHIRINNIYITLQTLSQLFQTVFCLMTFITNLLPWQHISNLKNRNTRTHLSLLSFLFDHHTCHQLHLLPRVTLSVERRVTTIPDLTDQTGRQGHVISTNQHAGPTLVSQRERQHLHLLLDWTNEEQGGQEGRRSTEWQKI